MSAEQARLEEYLRRNLVHAKAVGMQANAQAALNRIEEYARKPAWLIAMLKGIVERGDAVHKELAAHRNEVAP